MDARRRLKVPTEEEATSVRQKAHLVEYDELGPDLSRVKFKLVLMTHMSITARGNTEFEDPSRELMSVVGQYEHLIVNGTDKLGSDRLDAGRAANNQGVALAHLAMLSLESAFDRTEALELYREAIRAFQVATTFPRPSSGRVHSLAPEAARTNLALAKYYLAQAMGGASNGGSVDSTSHGLMMELYTTAIEGLELTVSSWAEYGASESESWSFAHVVQYHIIVVQSLCEVATLVGSQEGKVAAARALHRHIPFVLENIDLVRQEHTRLWLDVLQICTEALDVRNWAVFKEHLDTVNSWHAAVYDWLWSRTQHVLDLDILSIWAQLLTLQANTKQFDGGAAQQIFRANAQEKMELVSILSSSANTRSDNPVLFAGHLYKKGKKHKAFKRRGFVLRMDGITYADSLQPMDVADPNGVIAVADIVAVQPGTPLSAKAAKKMGGSNPNAVFDIVTSSRTYVCLAHTTRDRDLWISKIDAVRQGLSPSAADASSSSRGGRDDDDDISGVWDFIVHKM